MNLLTDSWIPVAGSKKKIGLERLLCSDHSYHLSLPRDDLEMATMQLLVSLVQVLFTPKDDTELRQRMAVPMRNREYQSVIAEKLDWFDLSHPQTPFMQDLTTPEDKLASMQGLFAGMPDGKSSTSHAHFVSATEMNQACPSCVAIVLFNRATSAPNFSGKHKGPLRGGAPITTLVQGEDLRQTLWDNVLSERYLGNNFPLCDSVDDQPVWVKPVANGGHIQAQDIGLTRGLFWQPIHVRLHHWQRGTCDLCGDQGEVHGDYLRSATFKYTVHGQWPHPHSPRVWDIKKGVRDRERFLSFTTTAPAWTRLTEMLVEQESKKSGMQPAAVVDHYQQLFPTEPIFLAVGGYRNKQASILQRRHETFSLRQGWQQNKKTVQDVVERGVAIKTILRNKLFGLGKMIGVSGLAAAAESTFYRATESLVQKSLRQMAWREAREQIQNLTIELNKVAITIFEEITQPYQHDLRTTKPLVQSRQRLHVELNRLLEEGRG